MVIVRVVLQSMDSNWYVSSIDDLYVYMFLPLLLLTPQSCLFPSRQDALAALDFVRGRTDIDTSQIFVFGRSLGGAVASWLALERPQQLRGLILENTFTSVVDMFFVLLSRMANPTSFERPLRFILRFFMTSHWRTIDLMPRLSVPTLFISGLDDELVPAAHMQTLYDAVPDSCYKEFYGVAGGMHNTTYIDGGPSYWHVYHGFVSRIARGDTK